MFIYGETSFDEDCLYDKELAHVGETTLLEKEMFEIIKVNNPFLNRSIAKNINITEKVMIDLLDNHSAYTMDINIAKNINVTQKIIDKLYDIADNKYKESLLKQDLDWIFSPETTTPRKKLTITLISN